ncbi:hypothetical protein BH10ACI1_BH10ACI1_18360 [soil metagenome]
MDLIFEQTANRHQCGCEVSVNDLKLPCSFSTSKTITLPHGLRYKDGRIEISEDKSATTMPFCANHEKRLRNAFDEFSKNG